MLGEKIPADVVRGRYKSVLERTLERPHYEAE